MGLSKPNIAGVPAEYTDAHTAVYLDSLGYSGMGVGTEAIGTAGTGDAPTATTTHTGTDGAPGKATNTLAVDQWTENCTGTTHIPDGETRKFAGTGATGRTITFVQSGITFTESANSDTFADVAAAMDGTTQVRIFMSRTGTDIEYTITGI